MITETAEAPSLNSSLERLRSDFENVQRELDQALGVWRQALITEKRDFQSTLQAKQRAWDEQEEQWQLQRRAYDEKILALQTTFQEQLTTTEQNALKALNELDDSWQRDKLLWSQDANRRIKELEMHETNNLVEIEKLQARIHELENQPVAPTNSEYHAALDMQQAWETDRRVWQTSVRETVQQLHEREALWQAEREHKDMALLKVQEYLVALQSQLAAIQDRQTAAPDFLESYLSSIENQISVIESFVQLAPPLDPLAEPSALR